MRVITLDANKTVISVKNVGENYILQAYEIENDLGELGQVMQEDGSFKTPLPIEIPQIHEPTNAELAQMISDLQADLMIAGVI